VQNLHVIFGALRQSLTLVFVLLWRAFKTLVIVAKVELKLVKG